MFLRAIVLTPNRGTLRNQIRSDILARMKTLTVTEVARNFSAVMDGVVSDQEEVVLVRNNKPIARLVPEPPEQNALEVLGDLFHRLDDATAEALAEAINSRRKSKRGTLDELQNPWDS